MYSPFTPRLGPNACTQTSWCFPSIGSVKYMVGWIVPPLSALVQRYVTPASSEVPVQRTLLKSAQRPPPAFAWAERCNGVGCPTAGTAITAVRNITEQSAIFIALSFHT